MSPFVRIHWPKETKAQLAEFRANVNVLAATCVPIGLVAFVMVLHQNPDSRMLLGGFSLATFLASWWMIGKPTTPFRETWTRPRPVSELDEDALRILSFLRSTAAKKLILTTAAFLGVVIIVIALIDWCVIQGRSFATLKSAEAPLITGIAVVAFLHFWVLVCTQLAILHTWIARHLPHILATYAPWPKDRPF